MRFLALVFALSCLTANAAFAGHTAFITSFKGTWEEDADGDGKVEKRKVTEADLLDDDSNFLVVIFDARLVGLTFEIEEWSDDEGADGIPDTFVREIMTNVSTNTTNQVPGSGRLSVILEPTDRDLDNDLVEEFNGHFLCKGKSKIDQNERPTKWSCKLDGVAVDEDKESSVPGAYLSGKLKSGQIVPLAP